MPKTLTYDDLKGKDKLTVDPPLKISWSVPVDMGAAHPNDPAGLADEALRIGYWLGLHAAKEKKYYTVPEAAELLHVHPNTIYRMTRSRRLEYYRAERQIRIPATEIERLRATDPDDQD